ncbi:MAG: 1-phosphofructokinase [Lachnospiraceae bacterium]|nr:1-phosphofructokinase [Lachnospiraceae bacterium]
MIYTVTLNPSLDYIVEVKDFTLGATNRTSFEQMLPGGKGLNVSFVVKNLGFETTALGFLAGFVGDEIEKRVAETGVRTEFQKLENGCSRINMKVRNVDGTEINGMGPQIPAVRIKQLLDRLEGLQKEDILVLAGSIPSSMPATIYSDIMKKLSNKEKAAEEISGGPLIVVDATKDLLKNVLPYHPFLIKPNHHELGELFHVTINTREEAVPYAKKLQEQGARNVLVSMGGLGAVLADETGRVYLSKAPEGVVINSVGAGDSMVAGFLAGWLERKNYEYAFRMGLAAGSASAFSENLATSEEVAKVYQNSFVK